MVENEFAFSKKLIDALPVPTGADARMRYYDSVMRGLCIRVTTKGRKSFYFYRKVTGRVVSEKFGDYPDLTVEQARGKAAELNGRIARGQRPWEESAEAKAEMTLAQLFEIYLGRHAKKTRKTWEVMQKDFNRIPLSFRSQKLSQITTSQAEKLHGHIGQVRGQYSANRAIQLLKAVYNKGKAWKLYGGDNPFLGITLFEEKSRERFLTKQEVGRLLKVLDESTGDVSDFIKLSLFTGVRKANLLSIRWEDISFPHATLTIGDTKNNTRQVIGLGVNELELLKERRKVATTEFVFPGNGKSGHLVDPKRAWSTLRKRAGIEDCTIHDLRRSLGAAMANANVNIALVKSALHHKDMKTTLAVYARTQTEAVRDAREAVQASWLQAAEEEESKVVEISRKKG